MKIKYLSGLLVLIFSVAASAQFANTTFWKRRQATLRFTTAPQSVYRLNCSSVVTVQAVNASSTAAVQPTDLTVNLSAPGLTFYSNANCSTPITSLTIPAGSSSADFYFVASGIGTSDLVASAAPFKDAVQTESSATNPFIWTGGGAPSTNWNTGANWSGLSAPGAGDRVVFDGSCVSNCSPNINVSSNVYAIRVLSGYGGTITQDTSRTFTIGDGGWFHESGTFAGGNSTVTIYGPFTVAGGTYTSTTVATNTHSHLLITGGAFTAGSLYTFNYRGSITPGSATFNNVTFLPSNGATYRITGTLRVNGNLTLNGNTNNLTLAGDVIDLKGNLTLINNGMPGSAEIRLTGSGTQTVDATAGNTNRNLPSLTIASTGTVNLVGDLNFQSNFKYVSAGTLNTGTAGLNFIGVSSIQTADFGNQTFYKISYSANYDFSILSDVTVSNSLVLAATLGNAGHINGPGKVNLLGDLSLLNHGAGQYGSLQVHFRGNNLQNVTASSGNAKSPGIVIDTSGTVNFPASFNFNNNFQRINGTISGLTSVSFVGNTGQTFSIDGGIHIFNDVNFSGLNGNTYNIIGNMNIAGTLNFVSAHNSIVKGSIYLQGNVIFTSYYSIESDITFNGTADQTVSYSGSFPNIALTVDKGSGTLRFLTDTNWGSSHFVLNNGSVDLNARTVRFYSAALNGKTITKNGGTLIVNGSTIGNGSFFGGTIAP